MTVPNGTVPTAEQMSFDACLLGAIKAVAKPILILSLLIKNSN